jgi:hypothetical protein
MRKLERLNVRPSGAVRTNQVAGFENFHFDKIIKPVSSIHISMSMSQQVVTVTYDLVPPEGTPRPNLEPSTSLTRPVASAPSASGCKEYYDALRAAIDEVKVVSGHELTAWRDAVGNRELGKEVKVNTKKEEDDEDGGEDVEGEE